MSALNKLTEALKLFGIEIQSVSGQSVKVADHFEVAVGPGGKYDLTDDGYPVATFDDLDELCRFIKG